MADDTEEITQWELVEIILGAPPDKRDRRQIEEILPWFKDRSAFFRMLEEESLIGMIKYAELLLHPPDSIVIRQGEIGDCFFVIVRGTVSVYSKPVLQQLSIVGKEINIAKGAQERMRFGTELAQLSSGRCFGELSVLTKDGERNASIITEETTLLIRFKRDIFLRFVHEKFANELLRKSGFVQTCSLFKKWPIAYKNLLTECLQIRHVEFGETVAEQGSDIKSLLFVVKGQAKLSTNTEMHLKQYRGVVSNSFYERMASQYKVVIDEDDDIHKFPVLLRRRRKEKEGFFATEMRQRPNRDVSVTVSVNGLIGDVEAAYDLPTYSATWHSLEEMTLYELDITNFIRLIVRKNSETYETMQKIAAQKVTFRNSTILGGIPLYSALLASARPRSIERIGQTNFMSTQLSLEEKRRSLREDLRDDAMQKAQAAKKLTSLRTRKAGVLKYATYRRRSLTSPKTDDIKFIPSVNLRRKPHSAKADMHIDKRRRENMGKSKDAGVKMTRATTPRQNESTKHNRRKPEEEVVADQRKPLKKTTQPMNKRASRASWTG